MRQPILLAALGVAAIVGLYSLHRLEVRTKRPPPPPPPAVVRTPIPVPIEKGKTLPVTLSDKGMRMAQSLVHKSCPPLSHEEAFAVLWAWASWKRGEINDDQYVRKREGVHAAAVMREATR